MEALRNMASAQEGTMAQVNIISRDPYKFNEGLFSKTQRLRSFFSLLIVVTWKHFIGQGDMNMTLVQGDTLQEDSAFLGGIMGQIRVTCVTTIEVPCSTNEYSMMSYRRKLMELVFKWDQLPLIFIECYKELNRKRGWVHNFFI